MRMSLRLALGALALAIATGSSGQGPFPKFSLSLRLPKPVVKSGSPVEMLIEKRNLTNSNLTVQRIVGSAEINYDVMVTDVNGREPSETRYGRQLHHKEPLITGFSAEAKTLAPGEALQQYVFLDRIYNLPPGHYSIQVSQDVYATDADVKAKNKTIVKSNAVTLTVTD